MSFRCTKPFAYGGRVYAGSKVVEDGDPILQTHARHFVKVGDSRPAAETASAAPNEARTVTPAPVPPVKKAAPKPVKKTYQSKTSEGDN